MSQELQASTHATVFRISLPILARLIQIVGLACFAYIVYKHVSPMLHAERDFRLDRPWLRIQNVMKFWFGQWKHPPWRLAGGLHLLILAGFLILVGCLATSQRRARCDGCTTWLVTTQQRLSFCP